jgi:pilus assembly protein TadC
MYERLCRVASRLPPFSQLGGRKKDKDLDRAVRFLAPKMKLTVRGVASASYVVFFVVFVGLLLLMTRLATNPLVIVPPSTVAALVAYYVTISHPVSLMNSYRVALSEEGDIVFEQFVLVFQSGGTIFDAIEMVAQSEHPYLSESFRHILRQTEDGVPPEKAIAEFARDQPSDDLRRYLLAILSSLEKRTDLLDLLSGESFEADSMLRQKNLELESRLLIVAALTTYLPIMITLAVSLAGYGANPLVIVIAPLLVGLNWGMASRFQNQFSAYFDRPLKSGALAPSQKDIAAEYDEFLNFLMLLGERLRSGDTLEVALPAIRDAIGAEVQRLTDTAIQSVYWKGLSIKNAMAAASEQALGKRVSQMMKVIALMCEASATQAGERITMLAAHMVKRSAIAKERGSIIAAQKLKIYVLSLTSAAVLGLLASLTPFLFIGALLHQGPLWNPWAFSLTDLAPLIITLAVTTVSTGFQNSRMVNGGRPALVGLACGLLFLCAFALSSVMLGTVHL